VDKITVRPTKNKHQCEVMVGKYRVAYVCYGEGMPINFLKKACSGVELTDQEKIKVAEETRRQMAILNQQKNQTQDRLAAIAGRGYSYNQGESSATEQGSDSVGVDEAANKKDQRS